MPTCLLAALAEHGRVPRSNTIGPVGDRGSLKPQVATETCRSLHPTPSFPFITSRVPLVAKRQELPGASGSGPGTDPPLEPGGGRDLGEGAELFKVSA